jgi:hypothetical protein
MKWSALCTTRRCGYYTAAASRLQSHESPTRLSSIGGYRGPQSPRSWAPRSSKRPTPSPRTFGPPPLPIHADHLETATPTEGASGAIRRLPQRQQSGACTYTRHHVLRSWTTSGHPEARASSRAGDPMDPGSHVVRYATVAKPSPCVVVVYPTTYTLVPPGPATSALGKPCWWSGPWYRSVHRCLPPRAP